jgi:hypothetical protein
MRQEGTRALLFDYRENRGTYGEDGTRIKRVSFFSTISIRNIISLRYMLRELHLSRALKHAKCSSFSVVDLTQN